MIYLIAIFLFKFLLLGDFLQHSVNTVYITLSILLLGENSVFKGLEHIIPKLRLNSCFSKHFAKCLKDTISSLWAIFH